MLMQTQSDVGVLGSIRSCFFHFNFVKSELRLALARDVFECNRFVTKILERQGIHVVARGGAI